MSPELKALHRIDARYSLKVAVFYALWAAGAAVSLETGWLLGDVVSAFALHGLIVLMHEAAHGLLARDPTANRWLGFVCGLPFLTSGSAYRFNHAAHHRVTGTDDDPADLVGAARRGRMSLRHVVLIVLGIGTFVIIPGVARDGFRAAPPHGRRHVVIEYAAIALTLAAFVTLAPWPVFCRVWLWPFLVLSVINNVRSLAEHAFTDRDSPLGRTRTVRSNAVLRFLFSNVNYHWEHHRYPKVPWYHLPALKALLAPGAPYEERGYLSWLWRDVLPRLWRSDCELPVAAARRGAAP